MNLQKTIENLEKNNMTVYYVEKKEEVVPLLSTLIPRGSRVSVGGSVTLFETGVIDHLKTGPYIYLDRYEDDLSPQEVTDLFRDCFSIDTYVTSTNALTEDGELYNVDARANRVSAMQYGPDSVIVIAGINKLVPDLTAAIHRVKTIAAPKNCVRLKLDTYCAKVGHCVSLNQENPRMTDGCSSDSRICCQYSISGQQRIKGRTKVIIVGENLGY